VKQVVQDFGSAAADGWSCWAFSNHDVIRHASRLPSPDASDDGRWNRLLIGLLASLRGSICIYQGEELGLPEADVAFEDLQDPYGIRFWPKFKGRDGCRTPMPWNGAEPHAGFTSGKPWLPVDPRHAGLAVAAQEGDDTSALAHYRRVLAFRRSLPALQKGQIEFIHCDDNVLAFTRTHGNDKIVCVFNMGAMPATVTLPQVKVLEDLPASGFGGTHEFGAWALEGFDAYFGRVA
jgi:alpha-glucosidase